MHRIRPNGSAEGSSVSGCGDSEDADSERAAAEPQEILASDADLVPTGSGSGATEGLPADFDSRADVDWQTAMKRAVRSAAQLKRILGLPQTDETDSAHESEGETNFPTFVPWEFLSRIRAGDPADPLLRQVLPSDDEGLDKSGFSSDPLGELDALASDGLLHKYRGRALVIASGACGVHCRYCFRREFPYTAVGTRAAAGSRADPWRASMDYVQNHPEIDELLLSGGDPLTMVDRKLDHLISAIEAVDHVRRLRIHTRMPIVIPQRVTPEFTQRLAGSRLAVWMVVHANHPNELDRCVLDRLAMLIDAGIPVLNQTVLLRGVNDDAETLIELSRKLVNHRIQPYYLHQLDRVRGAAHFEVPLAVGKRLVREMRESLPGYAVPTYVREEAGKTSKTPVADLFE